MGCLQPAATGVTDTSPPPPQPPRPTPSCGMFSMFKGFTLRRTPARHQRGVFIVGEDDYSVE